MQFLRGSLLRSLFAGSAILLKLLQVQSKVLAPMVDPRDPALVIPGQYIIVLGSENGAEGEGDNGNGDGDKDEEGYDSARRQTLSDHSVWLTALLSESTCDSQVQHTFDVEGLHGYSGRFSEQVIEQIRSRPEVKYVEPDQVVYALDMLGGRSRRVMLNRVLNLLKASRTKRDRQPNRKHKPEQIRSIRRIKNQRGAPWGLSRVSHAQLPFELDKYHYPRKAGKGVDVYVIDTGINVPHADFEGRAQWGVTIPEGDIDIDGNGHGTHCAGIIASRTYGIAKKAHVIAVKVLRTNGFGTNGDVIKGVEWTVKAARRGTAKGRRSVANMSLGGGRSLTLESAVNRAVKAGVHFAVAAGNDNEDACDYSPAAAAGPITVGATTNKDQMAFFSNHGPCVDIFAPGLDITSTWIGHRRAINTISGTSMASPHVAGVLALYLSERDYDPKTLKQIIVRDANEGLIEELPQETVNRLLCTRHLLESLEADLTSRPIPKALQI